MTDQQSPPENESGPIADVETCSECEKKHKDDKQHHALSDSLHFAVGTFDTAVRAFNDALHKVNSQNERDLKFRRWKFFATAALFIGLIFMTPVKDWFTQNVVLKNDYVNVVEINGEIVAGKEASSEAVIPLLVQAFEDSHAKGVVLSINSPGGSPVIASEIRNRIVNLREKYPEKEVIAIGKDMLTSGAYMIAIGADKIYSNTSTLVGSIGVIIRSFGFDKVINQYGVDRRILTAGDNKAGMDSFTPLSDKDRLTIEHNLELIHKDFIDMVKEARGERLDQKYDDVFSGKYWTGKEAEVIGLIDGTGYMSEIIDDHFGTTHVKTFKAGRDIWSVVTDPARTFFGGDPFQTSIQPLLMPY